MKATFRGEAQDFLIRTRLLEGDVVSHQAPDGEDLRGAVPYTLNTTPYTLNTTPSHTLNTTPSYTLNTVPNPTL